MMSAQAKRPSRHKWDSVSPLTSRAQPSYESARQTKCDMAAKKDSARMPFNRQHPIEIPGSQFAV